MNTLRKKHCPVSIMCPLYARASPKDPLATIGIYAGHITTPQGQRRDEPQHITKLLHGGELPVGAVATAAHNPGDEGSSGHGRAERH